MQQVTCLFLLAIVADVYSGAIVAPSAAIISSRNELAEDAENTENTETDSHPSYSFSYSVDDISTGDHKSQFESREGDSVVGRYTLLEPTGETRQVDYTADAVNGFNAVVSRHPAAKIIAAPAKIIAQPAIVAPVPTKYIAQPIVAAPAKIIAQPAIVAPAPARYYAPYTAKYYASAPIVAAPAKYVSSPIVAAKYAYASPYAAYSAPIYHAPSAAYISHSPLTYHAPAAAIIHH
ncbi:hypothetical protein ACKWTF_000724 [Chironomus riparius]